MTFTSNAAVIVGCDAIVDRCDLGATNAEARLRIYAGSVPADADAALGGATLLSEHLMSNPAFGAAADLAPGARATAGAIADDTSADATGNASFFRIVDRTGTTTVFQGTVGTSGADLNMNSIAIQAGALVQITSLTYTLPES